LNEHARESTLFHDPFVCRYLFDEEPYTEEAQACDLIKYFRQPEPRCQHRWVVVRKPDGEKMGTCGFHHWLAAEKSAEAGYDEAARLSRCSEA
jgi:ribosomal-protein-alanine N-acetyltransferase